jgi:hypothetical protein
MGTSVVIDLNNYDTVCNVFFAAVVNARDIKLF